MKHEALVKHNEQGHAYGLISIHLILSLSIKNIVTILV